MKRQFLVITLLIASATWISGQQPVPMHNGQQVTLRGSLVMRPGGRLQFVAVETAQVYVAAGMSHTQAPTREVGLSGYNRYDVLYAHRGQAVTVSGTAMTEQASPYYLHGVLLKANSIRLANGTELLEKPRATGRIAVDVGQYRASVVLPADLAQPWQYSAHGTPDPEHQFLSCSSNGGGDVVNCSCAESFRVLRAESPTQGVDAQVFLDSHTAQFGVGDDARRVELSVTCSR